ncbi:MAG TPA: ROK family protein [Lacunisphaera sp.]|jgi:predicted NBD/HSP70 family sugar kinase
MFELKPLITAPLEPEFQPASVWNRAYRQLVARDPGSRLLFIALVRDDDNASRHETRVLAENHAAAALTFRYVERLVKFLLWQQGGCRVLIAGADEVTRQLAAIYAPGGERAFDCDFMGEKIYRRSFTIEAVKFSALPKECVSGLSVGRHLAGCRIGFDIGGSDRKVAAVRDGRVIFSEAIAWDPYFQKDPAYHLEGIHDSIKRAAAYLPRVDAIGGSAAGVYINNEVRVASLFRGVTPELFERHVRRMFFKLQERWGGVPFEVANDGEVTALAGSMALDDNAVLGISMGTSLAGGYVQATGDITPWLNELAFAPIDYQPEAPADEWSGDLGCGVQYFSQQAVARFARRAGFVFADELPVTGQLAAVQQALSVGDTRAREIYETIGTCFGYALGHYRDFYRFRHVLLLGGVAAGDAGNVIVDHAMAVLQAEFPGQAGEVRLHLSNEKIKRHAQAIAAASLPALEKNSSSNHSNA